MKKRIILHIGLHKTATKYFQHHVFPFLPVDKFIYKPPKLTQYLLDFLMADKDDRKLVLETALIEKQKLLDANPDKTIIISNEAMSGNLFSAYKYWNESMSQLNDLFPDAKIILALRFQTDWLVSCYRESLHEHHYQNIESFLNFDIKLQKFLEPEHSKNIDNYATLDALNLDYFKMIDRLSSLYSKENISVYFFENFKNDKISFLKYILNDIGVDYSKINTKRSTIIPNRGYSAFSIAMSIERAKILKNKNLHKLIHRPIFFYGSDSIPAGNIELSILDKIKYWGPQFLRDNEEVRSPDYPILSENEKRNFQKSWRYIVKNVLDINEYIDWDMLGDMKGILDEYYREKNKELFNILDINNIPDNYYK
jgi:hypothetical protein